MKNLNSDQLRKLLEKHTRKMNWLAEQNDLIVELLAERGLKAIEKTAGEDLVCSADKMVIFNAAGAEVFNTDWPNPLIDPDQYEAHSRMAEWVSKFQKVREDRMPLTTEELNAGGWWCDDTSEYCRLALSRKGIAIKSQSWDGRYSFCFMDNDHAYRGRVYRGLPGEKSRVTCAKKQIRRIGNNFYWGAASDQAN